jgi:hypothetical protein
MRVFFAYFLVSVILLLSAKELLMAGLFKVYQEDIAATRCVYKFKPEVMCKGSCFLADQLEAAHETSQPEDLFFQVIFASKVFFTPSLFPMLCQPETTRQKGIFGVNELHPSLFPISIFHPPRCQA